MKIGNTSLILFFFVLCSCTEKKKKESLVESFRCFYAREVPADIFMLDKLHEFDLLKQRQETIGERYNYPNTFVVGLYNNKKDEYDRIHVVERFSPVENFEFIKMISDHYATDTTCLDNIQLVDTVNIDNKDVALLKDTLQRISMNEMCSTFKMKGKKFVVLIYRKTDPVKDETTGNWAMWKREIVELRNNKLETQNIGVVNEHLF